MVLLFPLTVEGAPAPSWLFLQLIPGRFFTWVQLGGALLPIEQHVYKPRSPALILLLKKLCILLCPPGTPLRARSKWPGSVRQGWEVVNVGDVLQQKGDCEALKLEKIKRTSTWILARTSGGSGGPWDRRSCRELRIT